ncbi:MAG: amylo-alpha-1,6-glucosidase [Spirochaetaceae bacterium]|nr:amylo-alpha-1,6-glucosidase [Spirochaetaceae bacterium]
MKLTKKNDTKDYSAPWLEKEWLETDGKGGYCSMTVPSCCTRKYHGLLVVPMEKFEGRYVLLSGYEILITDKDGTSVRLDTNQFPGTFHPCGFQYLEKFEKKIFPEWNYKIKDILISIEIFMTQESRVYFKVTNKSKKNNSFKVELSPAISYRNSHVLTLENGDLSFSIDNNSGNLFGMKFYENMPKLYFMTSEKTEFNQKKIWVKNREYVREMERGFSFTEDCYVPGSFTFNLKSGDNIIISAGLATDDYSNAGNINEYLNNVYLKEKIKRDALSKCFADDPEVIRVLKQEARHFLARNRDKNLSIIAGYPWFGEWGRDTMISLNGITACCGKPEEGLEILKAYASYIKDGLLPNTLGGSQGFESYNSIDAGLLYVWAAQLLWQSGENKKEIATYIFPAIEKIIRAYLDGKVPGLRISNNGFPEAGDGNTQLTWMDATVYEKPVTPRNGSPVEITALFYNALKFYLELLSASNMDFDKKALDTAVIIEKNFMKYYFISEGEYLADVVGDSWQDRSLRPNMLFALALPYPLVDVKTGKKIMKVVERELLTSSGLRTLSPSDSRFCSFYHGDGARRDGSYHQGTVWPWLLGIYVDAALFCADKKKVKAAGIEKILLAFLKKHIDNEGIGFVSEIFDGKDPCGGKGTYAQAWSSAEIIRAWEKIKKIKNSS